MTKAKLIRRVIGAVCLIAAVVMLIAGETKAGSGNPVGFVTYWLVCFVLAALALAAAILDLSAVRREARDEQRNLLQNALLDIESEKARRADAKKNPAKDRLQH